jgi:hypothetical protein
MLESRIDNRESPSNRGGFRFDTHCRDCDHLDSEVDTSFGDESDSECGNCGSVRLETSSDWVRRTAESYLLDDRYPDLTAEQAMRLAEEYVRQETGE